MSEEAAKLPSLHTPPDAQLWTDDGGCFPVHASILEMHSQLLAEGLCLAREERVHGTQLLLHVPQVGTAQLLNLLLAIYSFPSSEHMKAIKQLDKLQGLAEAAALLQCSHMLQLAETSVIKNGVLSMWTNSSRIVDCSIWAGQLKLHVLEDYCACLFFETHTCSDTSQCGEGVPMSKTLKKAGQLYNQLLHETAQLPESRKRIIALIDAAAFADKVMW